VGAKFRRGTLRRKSEKEGEVKFYDYGNICCTMYSYNHKPSSLRVWYILAFLNLGFTGLFGVLWIDFRSSVNVDGGGKFNFIFTTKFRGFSP
jgi:hypothetical protein